jgi:predicted component of type VI protein secretion system
MDEYYVTLAEALQERLDVISDRRLREQNPTAQLARLRQASERIEQLKKNLPLNADPMLKHYLDRMSLSKALEFVQNHYLR